MRNKSLIYKSLIKNGYSNFKLEILEYCTLDVLIEKEQYYLDNFKPEYNILKIASSFRGFKHSELTKKAMSLRKKDYCFRYHKIKNCNYTIKRGIYYGKKKGVR
jgi:group I intron endonuclease